MGSDALGLVYLLLAAAYIGGGIYLYRCKVVRFLDESPSMLPRIQRGQVRRYFEAHADSKDWHLRYFRYQRYVGLMVLFVAYCWWRSLP